MATIVGTLLARHSVDQNGSLSIDVPLHLPPAKLAPNLSFSYHSASNTTSALGVGWTIKGASSIERVPPTVAQDNIRGAVSYGVNDKFSLDGQRLISIGNNEYRFELEQWSKILAYGTNPANPDYWVEYLPDGSIRSFGDTTDSNVKAAGGSGTRAWAISQTSDSFKNYVSFSYLNDTQSGAYYLDQVKYGGNKTLNMDHQRVLKFEYEVRSDVGVRYHGGYKVSLTKRLSSVSTTVKGTFAHKHLLRYSSAPLTGVSRLVALTLADPSGAEVRPLEFDWVNGDPAVFNAIGQSTTIDPKDDQAIVMPLDVYASGKSDLVVASKRFLSGSDRLHVDVYRPDANGIVSATPASSFDGLPFPSQLLPLEFNGDGCNDLLHISTSVVSGTHTLTVLLSTPNGYAAQPSLVFKPESISGTFHVGDYEGNGQIGLCYLYQVFQSGMQLRFVQFVSDRQKFIALDPRDGPAGVSLDHIKVVVGDMNGDNAEDVFIMYSSIKSGTPRVQIEFLQADPAGRLAYRSDKPLLSIAESISWTDDINFLPYSADEDGKTSILVISKDLQGQLRLQIIRTTGLTLLAPTPPIQTNVQYNGTITLARTSSTTAVDLVVTTRKPFNNPPCTELTLLRFFNDSFVVLAGLRQPGLLASHVHFADLRGTGRVDCLLATSHYTGKITITPMSSAASQPIDYISSYKNGLGAKLAVQYAPLSDRTMYIADGDNSPRSAVNALARNASFSATLAPASTISQPSAHTRSQLVYFPAYAVKQVQWTPCAARPDVIDQTGYTYKNARYGYDGRGWRGFETVASSSLVVGSTTATDYYQEFPFLGQVKEVRVQESGSGRPLQITANSWEEVAENGGKTKTIRLSRVVDSKYESGVLAHSINVAYTYDAYTNITSLSMASSQSGSSALVVSSTFNNDVNAWVIGQKTLETVKQGQITLKQNRYAYLPGSMAATEESKWIADNNWSTQTFEFDAVGNETTICGPGPARKQLTYDDTYTNLASSAVYTSSNTFLTETTVSDLVSGKITSSRTPNGETTTLVYDVLGRLVEASITTDTATKIVEKHAFETDGVHFYQIIYTDSEQETDTWFKQVSHIDGADHVWRTEIPRPDDPSKVVHSDVEYDGAGRIVKRARDYFAGSTPSFATFAYDALSRLTRQSLPPASANVSPLISTVEYSFSNGRTHVKETRTNSQSGNALIILREIQHLPNPEPSANNYTKSLVASSTNEMHQTVTTSFDGLGRPTAIFDPSGTNLTLTWDGTGRMLSRKVINAGAGTTATMSHTSMQYEDSLSRLTVRNEISGTSSVTTSDWARRPLSKVTPNETLTFSYDTGGTYTKERLVSVTSSQGIAHRFDYDQRGNVSTSTVTVDSHAYTTQYQWTLGSELRQVTNPDGTVMKRTLYADGESVKRVELTNPNDVVCAYADFGDYNDVQMRPLSCRLGNGITATSRLADNGSLADLSLTKDNVTIHRQSWSLDAFSRINRYDVNIHGFQDESTGHSFQYNAAGQLLKRQLDSSPSLPVSGVEDYAYDSCGNLQSKGGKTFVNQGWKLQQVQDPTGAIETSFQYSADGNMISKKDRSGRETSSMQYDSEGRLVIYNNTRFVYDFTGRLLKAVLPNGDSRIYPTQSYEITIPSSGPSTHSSYLIHGYRRACLTTKASTSTTHYFHTDHLGSVVAASDDKGVIISRYKYDSFGKVVVSGPDVSRYKFSGKELFNELYYFGSRFYDYSAGRFLTLDDYPVNLEGIRTSTFNMYSFARNDPMNFVDLNGNAPWWHWLVDALLIVAGVALMFVPGVNAVVLGVVTGAIVGAGISGLTTDVKAAIKGEESSDKEWGISLGLGAIFGGISGGAAAGVDVLLPAITITDVMSNAGAVGARLVGSWALRTALRVGIKTAVESGLGAVRQITLNGIEGNRWDEGVGTAAGFSALSGFGSSLKGEASSFLKPLKGQGIKAKFWTNRNWRVYRVAHQEKLSSLGAVNKSVEYGVRLPQPQVLSLRQTGGFDAIGSVAEQPTRFLPTELITHM